jgi:hypothetical protein
MFSRKAIVAGILGTIATTGWTIQGVGNAFYYRQVAKVPGILTVMQLSHANPRYGHTIQAQDTPWRR